MLWPVQILCKHLQAVQLLIHVLPTPEESKKLLAWLALYRAKSRSSPAEHATLSLPGWSTRTAWQTCGTWESPPCCPADLNNVSGKHVVKRCPNFLKQLAAHHAASIATLQHERMSVSSMIDCMMDITEICYKTVNATQSERKACTMKSFAPHAAMLWPCPGCAVRDEPRRRLKSRTALDDM